MKFIIDAGHGGTDPGAIGPTGLMEKDVTLDIATRLASIAMMRGHFPVLTRMGDETQSLKYRTDYANKQGGRCFISIHCNSFTNQNPEGFEIWTYLGQSQSDVLATAIVKQWIKTFPSHLIRSDWSDGDVDKQSKFYVLKNTVMPAVLLETAFINNPKWETWLRDTKNHQIMAETIMAGIENWVNK